MAALGTVIDLCNASSLNVQWGPFLGGGATLTEDASGITFNYPASSTSSTDADISTATGTFASQTCFMRVKQVPSAATSADFELRIQTDGSNWFRWVYEGGTLFAQRKKAGTLATVFSVAYSAATHQYWRISEAGGTVTWYTGVEANGIITWTSQGTFVHGMTITTMLILVAATCFQAETNPGVAQISNFNIVPPVPGNWQVSYPSQYHRQALKRHLIDDIFNATAPNLVENITLDKWVPSLPDILFRKKDRPLLYPANQLDPNPPAPAEVITPDKWIGSYPDYLYRNRSWRPTYQWFIDYKPEVVASLGWRGYQPDLVWRDKPRFQDYPSIFQWEPDPLDELGWRGYQPDYINRVKPRLIRYPSQFEPIEEGAGIIWHRAPLVTYPDYIWRNKSRRHIVPAEYRWYDLIFQYCDPLTNWTPVTEPTNNWTPNDPGGAIAFTPNSVVTTGWVANDPGGAVVFVPVDEPVTRWDPLCKNN